MFLRFTQRLKDGKAHRYWSIVKNKRCAGGKVVQRPVLYLGEINDNQLADWCQHVVVADEACGIIRWVNLTPLAPRAGMKTAPLPRNGCAGLAPRTFLRG